VIIEEFNYERKHYIIDFVGNSVAFYIREFDFIKDTDSSALTNDIKKPVRLIHRIARSIESFIYERRIPYFTLYADNEKRVKLYKRLLNSLKGYSFIEHRGMFYITKD